MILVYQPCVVRSRKKEKPRNRHTMNTGEIITTEINTEIKVEVQLETASIVKVETTKGKCNKAVADTQSSDFTTCSKDAPSTDKSRDEIKAAREAKKLAKQAKKQKIDGTFENDAIVKTEDETKAPIKVVNANNAPSNAEVSSEKNRDQVKAEREAKKQAKQAAKAAKAGGAPSSGPMQVLTEKLNQVNICATSTVASDEASMENKVSQFLHVHVSLFT